MATGIYDQESPNLLPDPMPKEVVGVSTTMSTPVPDVPVVPVGLSPARQGMYCRALRMRDLTFAALEKATVAGKSYNVEGMAISRYDLDQLRLQYVFWAEQVEQMERHGNTSTMAYRRIIPLDL